METSILCRMIAITFILVRKNWDSSTSTTSSEPKYCDLPPSAARCTFQFCTFFFSTHTCAERKFFFTFYLKHHSHLDIMATPSTCSITEGLPVFQGIGKTCKSICISIKRPGVTVAYLIPKVRRCGFDSRGGN